MSSRRNFWIRTIAGIAGDVAVGITLSSTCLWIIDSAALGLFLSFLLWIVAILLGLACSQYLVHPLVTFALSDRKLDRSVNELSALARAAVDLGTEVGWPSLDQWRQGLGRMTKSFTTA